MTSASFDTPATPPRAPRRPQASDAPGVAASVGDRLWAPLEPALGDLKMLVAALDREALRTGTIAAEGRGRLEAAFASLERLLAEVLDPDGDAPEDIRVQIGARVQAELLPLLLLSENGERWYAKPRGYAGDYLSIARMYDDEARGHGRVGAAIDRCFLGLAAVRAVQNRRGLLADEIRASILAAGGRTTRVASLACGPARELFDVYATLGEPAVLASTLVDIDLHALAHVADQRDRVGLRRQMTLCSDNLVHLATGRATASFAYQDLVYSIGLIDYFDDPFVVKLLDFVHGVLRPGGRVILGNFHPRNGTRAVMDHVLDWKLVHRTEADMDRLFRASSFGRPCTRIVYEPQRINLFAECVR